jgi:hypothetical protein
MWLLQFLRLARRLCPAVSSRAATRKGASRRQKTERHAGGVGCGRAGGRAAGADGEVGRKRRIRRKEKGSNKENKEGKEIERK